MKLYDVSNEYNIAELLSKFEYGYILDVIEDRLQNTAYENSLNQPNIIMAFEENFKLMNENFPSDSQNIQTVRDTVYRQIISILCDKFGLRFNELDENIDVYTAAFYLYDFLVSNRNNNIIKFYTAFIINNKNYLYNMINSNVERKKDNSVSYNKHIFSDNKYVLISSRIDLVIKYVSTLDIQMSNIFETIYMNREIVMFLDNAFADVSGNFFTNHYYNSVAHDSILPIVITNIRLQLQKIVGLSNKSIIADLLNMNNNDDNKGE